MVEHSDADQVLSALERHFGDDALEVVRNGNQLTVYGLGPSYRTMNRSDRTIVEVTPNHTGTIVRVDSQFLASALMGTMAQDTVVRSKIERVFQSVREQLRTESIAPVRPPMAAKPSPSVETVRPIAPPSESELRAKEAGPLSAPPVVTEQKPKSLYAQLKEALPEIRTVPVDTSAPTTPLATQSVNEQNKESLGKAAMSGSTALPITRPPSVSPEKPSLTETQTKLPTPAPTSSMTAKEKPAETARVAPKLQITDTPSNTTSVPVSDAISKPVQADAESKKTIPPQVSVPVHWAETAKPADEAVTSAATPSFLIEDDQVPRKRSMLLPFAVMIVLLVALASYFALRHRSALKNFFIPGSSEQVISASNAGSVAPATPVTPNAMSTAEPTVTTKKTSTTEKVEPSASESSQDVKEWIKAWAAAMRTRSAQTQVSFYADPVDRYFLRSAVDRDQLLKDKQAEIDKRQGTWTVDAENVVIASETASDAVVRLTKHITQEAPPGIIREWHIRTQLKLKRINGNWKITAEQTLS
ncbi:MAG TPA: hypothetical protein VFE38_09760 [Edaphobacter sp.]|nr:hypothetical protein [Edaphobacter sp.]